MRGGAVLVAAIVSASACGRGTGVAARPGMPRTSVGGGTGRPWVSVVERDGDGRGAIAIAVTTDGIAPDSGALVAVSLASLVEERLAARGVADFSIIGGWDGWRLRMLVATSADAAKLVDVARDAMLAPVAQKEPALVAVARKVRALARRPLPDRTAGDVARCTGEAYGTGDEATPTTTDLETWRRAAHGLGRVAIATAGDVSLADGVADALARGPVWPNGAPIVPSAWPPSDARPTVYDASGEIAPGAARIVVTARTSAPERAAAAAPLLGDPHGPLVTRLAALEAPARVRSVVATAHVDGGCVAASVDLSARDLVSEVVARIATAAVLARQELAVEIADIAAPPELGRALATRALDPRDAAERAAWWDLAGRGRDVNELRLGLTVGVAAARDAPESVVHVGSDSPPRTSIQAALKDAIRSEIDRATVAAHSPVVEARTRVERGQGEAWVLLASPCGTLAEANHDAGTGAAVATAAAMQVSDDGDARMEPFIAADGIGVLAHGPARAGESPQAHARRLADLAGRAFAADALGADRVTRARTVLLARAGGVEARALAALGGALLPSHPSWIAPLGTTFGLGSVSDETIAMRAAGVRAGPLRVAVLADSDSAQADAAVRAVDRWVARRPGETRSCPPLPTIPGVRPGTYAVELPATAPSEALLALPLPAGDEAARIAATWTAMALDGSDGLLAHAVGLPLQGDLPGATLARAWSAGVVGPPRSSALVVRVVATDASLDAAVARARALLERLRQGALREEDRSRAAAALTRDAVASSLDPRARAIDLWRGKAPLPAPSLDVLRAFASATLRDDALIIVALRPMRGDAERSAIAAESRTTSRESSRE